MPDDAPRSGPENGPDVPLFGAAAPDDGGDGRLFPAPVRPAPPHARRAGPARTDSRFVGTAPSGSWSPGGWTTGDAAPPAGPPPGRSAPPTRPPDQATPTGPTAPAAGGAYVGAVDGPVIVETARNRFRGYQTLLVASALATVAIVGRAILANAMILVNALLPLLLIVAMLAIYRVVLGPGVDRLVRWALRSLGSLVRRVSRVIGSIAMRVGRRAVSRGTTGGLRMSHAELPLTVRRFRVRSLNGESRRFVVYGNVKGGEIRTGDIVRISSRRTRGGHFMARSVDILGSPSGPPLGQVTARPPLGFLITRWGSRLSYILAALVLLWTGLALTGVNA